MAARANWQAVQHVVGPVKRFSTAAPAGRRLALTRLPTVVFPASPLTLRVSPGGELCPNVPLSLPSRVLGKCEADGGGLLATVPFSAPDLGVRLQLLARTEQHAHFVVTDRVRLAALAQATAPTASVDAASADLLLDVEHECLADRADLDASPEQAERAAEEAALVPRLLNQATRGGKLSLDLGLDELGVEHAEFCRHPSWAASKVLPRDASALSFWLPARLPLTTELKSRFLFAFSSLWRLQAAIDAIRFLDADALHDGRYLHRFIRIVDSPATDVCGHGFIARPRMTIGLANSSRVDQRWMREAHALDVRVV
jgi:hypothetical protein